MKCTICHDECFLPVRASCFQHIFCLFCLEQWHYQSHSQTLCPLCRVQLWPYATWSPLSNPEFRTWLTEYCEYVHEQKRSGECMYRSINIRDTISKKSKTKLEKRFGIFEEDILQVLFVCFLSSSSPTSPRTCCPFCSVQTSLYNIYVHIVDMNRQVCRSRPQRCDQFRYGCAQWFKTDKDAHSHNPRCTHYQCVKCHGQGTQTMIQYHEMEGQCLRTILGRIMKEPPLLTPRSHSIWVMAWKSVFTFIEQYLYQSYRAQQIVHHAEEHHAYNPFEHDDYEHKTERKQPEIMVEAKQEENIPQSTSRTRRRQRQPTQTPADRKYEEIELEPESRKYHMYHYHPSWLICFAACVYMVDILGQQHTRPFLYECSRIITDPTGPYYSEIIYRIREFIQKHAHLRSHLFFQINRECKVILRQQPETLYLLYLVVDDLQNMMDYYLHRFIQRSLSSPLSSSLSSPPLSSSRFNLNDFLTSSLGRTWERPWPTPRPRSPPLTPPSSELPFYSSSSSSSSGSSLSSFSSSSSSGSSPPSSSSSSFSLTWTPPANDSSSSSPSFPDHAIADRLVSTLRDFMDVV